MKKYKNKNLEINVYESVNISDVVFNIKRKFVLIRKVIINLFNEEVYIIKRSFTGISNYARPPNNNYTMKLVDSFRLSSAFMVVH